MTEYYHTALSGGETFVGVDPVDRVEHNGCVAIRNDIVVAGLPEEFKDCDVIYSDTPWPHGLQHFDSQAGVSGRSYGQLSDALEKILRSLEVPVYLTLGKSLLRRLPAPNGQCSSTLNKGSVTLAWWNVDHRGPLWDVREVQRYLGSKYSVCGDFFCGYGQSLFTFMEGGGVAFVASDYDPTSIAVVGKRLKGEL